MSDTPIGIYGCAYAQFAEMYNSCFHRVAINTCTSMYE